MGHIDSIGGELIFKMFVIPQAWICSLDLKHDFLHLIFFYSIASHSIN